LPDPFTGRAAIYYAPARNDPLWRLGCTWLGRDSETGEILPQPEGIAPFTTSPARYGFHATLKPPMKLAKTHAEFLADVKKLASRIKPFDMPNLDVRRIGRFTALCLAAPSPAFQNLADKCVEFLDPHRAPESAAGQQNRAAGRTPRQIQNIERWGYPLVFQDWQFHITLSNATDDENLVSQAKSFFGKTLQNARQVSEICVFVEPEPGNDFLLKERIELG